MNAVKSVIVTGNLNERNLVYVCYPVNEFRSSKWKMCVSAVVFDSADTISETCVITSNFVTSSKRSSNGEVLVYRQPLNVFHLKTSPTATRGIFRFGEKFLI